MSYPAASVSLIKISSNERGNTSAKRGDFVLDFIPFLREIEKHPVVTFLTAAKDVQHSHLPILKEVIEDFEKNKS